jgi:AAA+ ATPase superfamily predicted ATPase
LCFVGRRQEMRKIIHSLEKGRHVIITGIYGIGKTRLMEHIAKEHAERWQFTFVDFSRTAGNVCKSILSEYAPRECYCNDNRPHSYKAGRYLLTTLSFAKRQPVIVLDNISKLTRQKFTFLRELSLEKQYLFIAIVEAFLSSQSLFFLRSQLYPAEIVHLRRLRIEDATLYFQNSARKHNLDWTNKQATALAGISGGYPLGMHQTMERHLQRNPKESNPQEN